MLKEDLSDSETRENDSDSSSEEVEEPKNGGTPKITDYEKQRMKRIEENRARMEALGLHKMASSLMGSVQKKEKKKSEIKGKRKVVEEDEEYRPPEGEEGLNSSSEGDENGDDESGGMESFQSRKKKAKKKISTPNKKVSVQNLSNNSDFVYDDDALMQAIALSLQDSAGFLDVVSSVPSKSYNTHLIDGTVNERKRNGHIQEDTGKRKRKKSISSRVQMTEDELIVHFFQFDVAGKGSITLRDLRRVAGTHDFMWSDKEMADMIYVFDSDGDGKLSLDDFQKIVSRCNMIQVSENVATGSKA